jgi:glycosyltransferase involved in cell wall biosynthesis
MSPERPLPQTDRVFLLSTVTPVFRGSRYLRQLVEELERLREDLASKSIRLELREAIFVADSPIDDSEGVLAKLASEHDWIRVLTLSRNYGQHPATVAGILHSSGDWIATLDEDLQHHPKTLLPMLAMAVAGHHDVVYAKPLGPVHRSGFRNVSSRLFKRVVIRLSGNRFAADFNSFRLMRGSVARASAAVSGHDTYFDVALTWFTDRLTSCETELRDPRGADSGYRLGALLSHARRMLYSSEIGALRLGTAVGLLALFTSLALGAFVVIFKLARPELVQMRGWPSLILAISFFGGLTTFLAGLAVEFSASLVLRAQGRPTFFVIDRTADNVLSVDLDRFSHR